jgi:hypothetical protein
MPWQTYIGKVIYVEMIVSFRPKQAHAASSSPSPLKRGFAVIGQLAEDEEAGVRRIVGKSSELLTWRSACDWLEHNGEAGLAGDVLCAAIRVGRAITSPHVIPIEDYRRNQNQRT